MQKSLSRKDIWLMFAVSCVVWAAGCNEDPDCFTPFTTRVTVKFVKLTTLEDSVQITESVKILGFDQVYYADTDTAIYQLPIDIESDTTTYIITTTETDTLRIDTLILAYNRSIRYVSAECGVQHRVTNVRVVDDTFEILSVVSSQLHIDSVNVQISK